MSNSAASPAAASSSARSASVWVMSISPARTTSPARGRSMRSRGPAAGGSVDPWAVFDTLGSLSSSTAVPSEPVRMLIRSASAAIIDRPRPRLRGASPSGSGGLHRPRSRTTTRTCVESALHSIQPAACPPTAWAPECSMTLEQASPMAMTNSSSSRPATPASCSHARISVRTGNRAEGPPPGSSTTRRVDRTHCRTIDAPAATAGATRSWVEQPPNEPQPLGRTHLQRDAHAVRTSPALSRPRQPRRRHSVSALTGPDRRLPRKPAA